MKRSRLVPIIGLLLLNVAASACSVGDLAGLLGQSSKPRVSISSPPSNSDYREGDTVTVQSVATDAAGVVRVDLLVDDQVVLSDKSANAKGQSLYSLSQTWKATPGDHVLSVVAYNAAGVPSNPTGVSVFVQASSTAAPSSTATLPSATSPASLSPTVPSSTCADNAAFVADVTIPDGTAFAPGQTFNKTWRVRNTGCPWVDGYQLAFISGEAMSTVRVIAVKKTANGETADLSVAMTAPTGPGTHVGTWRLRNLDGTVFGTGVTVKINVTAPAAAGPTQAPAKTACSGTPVISSFVVTPNQITAGGSATLSWGAVTNADSVDIEPIGSVATPGAITVSPSTTTVYAMTAHCVNSTAYVQVTLTVPFAIMGAVTSVNPTSNSGSCSPQKTFAFSADVSTNGSGNVTYRWERSDGSWTQSPITIYFTEAGKQTVTDSWTLGTPGKTASYSARLHILSPTDVTTNDSTFTLSCQ